jgi:hypothetical protein
LNVGNSGIGIRDFRCGRQPPTARPKSAASSQNAHLSRWS